MSDTIQETPTPKLRWKNGRLQQLYQKTLVSREGISIGGWLKWTDVPVSDGPDEEDQST